MRELQPGYFKDWIAGTELGRDGFKKIMQIELRRQMGWLWELGVHRASEIGDEERG